MPGVLGGKGEGWEVTKRRTQNDIPNFPHFFAWLEAQGETEADIAKSIGVSQRCISYWLNKKRRWPTVEALRSRPDGLAALVEDLTEMQDD